MFKYKLSALIIIIIFSLMSIKNVQAQLSKKHFIPPLTYAETGNANPENQYFYISTPSNKSVSYTIKQIGATGLYFSLLFTTFKIFFIETLVGLAKILLFPSALGPNSALPFNTTTGSLILRISSANSPIEKSFLLQSGNKLTLLVIFGPQYTDHLIGTAPF